MRRTLVNHHPQTLFSTYVRVSVKDYPLNDHTNL